MLYIESIIATEQVSQEIPRGLFGELLLTQAMHTPWLTTPASFQAHSQARKS